MSFHASAAVFSARSDHLSKFRNHLMSSVCAALIIAASGPSAHAQEASGKYFNADGSKTDDLEKAAATWRTPEFISDWGLSAMRAEYAYAFGATGKGSDVGVMDSGIDTDHPEYKNNPRIHLVNTVGEYFADSTEWEDENGGPFKKGEAFNVSGAYNSKYNDSHGTHVSGTIGASRDDKGMHGVAFDVNLYEANTHGTDDNRLQGSDTLDYNYFMAAYKALSANKGVTFVNNSWGSDSHDEVKYFENQTDTIPNFTKAYSNFRKLSESGNKTWLDAVGDAAVRYGIIQVVSASNDGPMRNPDLFAGLPFFRPELEDQWLAVAWANKGPSPDFSGGGINTYSNRCGVARYWCVDAPGSGIYSTIPKGKYLAESGTSMSAPHATGALAVIQSRFPYMTPQQVLQVLLTTSVNKDGMIRRIPVDEDGWGDINLKHAMNGPGQFITGKFDINTPSNIKDTWSNPITDDALLQRPVSERADLQKLVDELATKGWDKGPPTNVSVEDKDYYNNLVKTIATRKEAIAMHVKITQGSLTKSGAGSLWLTGKNSYRGDTVINGGELGIGLGGSIVSASIINDTGLLTVDGTAAAVTANAGGRLKINTTGVTGDLTLNGGFA
ncbi:S8 family serine peptidase, partial [Phyllobacterium myrsinacearum]